MMRGVKIHKSIIWKTSILFLLLFFMFVLSLLSYMKLDTAMDRATIRMEQGLSYTQVNEILKNEDEQINQVRAVFYQKKIRTDVRAEFVTEIETDIIESYGDVRLLTHGMEILAENDLNGCLISEGLAQAIFKSTKVQGNQIKIGKESYTVRGVYIEDSKQLIRLNRDDKMAFHQVRIQKQDNKTASTTLQEFATRHGLTGNTLQWTEYVGIVKGLFLLAQGMLAILLWCKVVKGIVRQFVQEIPRSKIQTLSQKIGLQPRDYQKMLKITYIVVTLVLLIRQIHIPIEMVPSKWSDFAYWGNWFRSISRNIDYMFALEKLGYEQEFFMQGLYSGVGSVGAVVLILILLKNHEIK